MPPLNWTVGVIDEGFAFHHISFDNRRYHPEWGEQFASVQNNNNSLWGYVCDDGTLKGVTAVDQHTRYRADGITPDSIDLVLSAADGKHYEISGRTRASTHVQAWPNMGASFSLFEWRYGTRIGYGDVQGVFYRDAYRLMSANSAA